MYDITISGICILFMRRTCLTIEAEAIHAAQELLDIEESAKVGDGLYFLIETFTNDEVSR